MLKLAPPEWGSPLDYEEENLGPRSDPIWWAPPPQEEHSPWETGVCLALSLRGWCLSLPSLGLNRLIWKMSRCLLSHSISTPTPRPCILSEATPWEQPCPQRRCAFLPSALPIQSDRMAARPVLTAPVKLLDNGPQEWWGSQFLTQCWSTQTHHTVGRTHAFGSSEVFPELWLAFCL